MTSMEPILNTTLPPILMGFSEEEWRQYFYQILCATRESYKTRMAVFAAFVICGVIGNAILLSLILKDKQLRNSPNILICNLALADLMYILVVGPIRIEHEIHPCWFRGALACALKNFAPVVCQCACVYSLVALSRERYTAIVTGFKAHMANKTRLTVCWAVAAWIFGILFASPILTEKFSHLSHEILCSSVKRGSFAGKFYEVVKVLFLYIIPVIIILVHYLAMAETLLSSTKNFKSNSSQFVRQVNARKRLAYLSVTLSIFFVVFWLPSYAYTLSYHFKPQDEKDFSNLIFRFRQVHYFMSLANSSLNPWLVFALSSSHRSRLFAHLGCNRMPRHISKYRRSNQQRMTLQKSTSVTCTSGQITHATGVTGVNGQDEFIKLTAT